MTERLVLGSRGSELALAQARLVETALRKAWPGLEVVLEIIRTSGDEGVAPVVDRKAGRKGMFTREIEKQLIVRRIDVAVHSAKDLPSERSDELEIVATLPRAKTEDVLVKKGENLPLGAIVATGSVRRQYQLRRWRPDLRVVDLRGNVPTRLRKLRENETWSGIVLARAGLDRLGLDLPMEILSPDDFVPAGGQGIIALQIRRENAPVRRILGAVNDRDALAALRAEREFLRLLNGDCDSPVGVHAALNGMTLAMQAQVFDPELRTGKAAGAVGDPEAVARSLMQVIYG